MDRIIGAMDGHVVVCGWGRVGRAIARYVTRLGSDVVVIDVDPHNEIPDLPVVVGDANEDEVLLAAGIERASVVIAALPSDIDNLSLTLTIRSLAPDVFLVVRTAEQRHERKFFQAGADRVVNPYEIGGSRMGAVAMQPSVAEFLDEVLHDESHDVEIHELTVQDGSRLVGQQVGSALRGDDQPVAIAVRPVGGPYVANPPDGLVLGAGDVMIVLGNHEQLKGLRSRTGSQRRLGRYRGVDLEEAGGRD